MNNPFSPPRAKVEDMHPQARAGWAQTILVVSGISLLALAASWIGAPFVATTVAEVALGTKSEQVILLLDLACSAVVCFGAAYLAAISLRGRHWFGALGVATICWAVYLAARGGPTAMLNGEFPLGMSCFHRTLAPHLLPLYSLRAQRAAANEA